MPLHGVKPRLEKIILLRLDQKLPTARLTLGKLEGILTAFRIRGRVANKRSIAPHFQTRAAARVLFFGLGSGPIDVIHSAAGPLGYFR